jgi:hypothetical protein
VNATKEACFDHFDLTQESFLLLNRSTLAASSLALAWIFSTRLDTIDALVQDSHHSQ